MYTDQSSHPADVRPRRERRPPAWFDEYDVEYPNYNQYPHPPPRVAGVQDRGAERAAKMDPLAHYLPTQQSDYAGATLRSPSRPRLLRPLYQSTPVYPAVPAPEAASAILDALKQLQEDNQKLHHTVSQMQQQINTRYSEFDMLPPSPPPPAQPIHPSRNYSYVVDELTERMQRTGMSPQRRQPATPEYCEPDPVCEWDSISNASSYRGRPKPSAQAQQPRDYQQERVYRGPKPKIPHFTKPDPREFNRLKTALDNLLPDDATERFKYQILVDHLKFEEALLIADSYTNSKKPYSDTMGSLIDHYGQPHQLALRHIAEMMDAPNIRANDTGAFKRFALRVRALYGMLDQQVTVVISRCNVGLT